MLAGFASAHVASAQIIEAQAIPARPFGVGAVTFRVPEGARGEAHDFFVEEQNGRALYPVFSAGRLSRLLGGAVAADNEAGSRTALFLFRGREPLQLTIYAPAPLAVDLRPEQVPPRTLDRLLTRWWREYHATATALAKSGDYPPIVQTYLTGMLGQRLGLRPPLLARLQQDRKSQLQQTLDLLLATEEMHIETLRQTMAGARRITAADQAIPPEIAWSASNIAVAPGVEVEPIARHVPQECFYVRFGNFENYLWLEDLLASYGGDAGRLVTARGQDAKLGDRRRRQLALPLTALTKIFGGQLIEDVALIGRDAYLQDGAAIGVLLQARNTAALSASLQQQRLAAMLAEKSLGATMETVSIAGHDVSLLSTPDNQLRSFHATDGDFHLVTTSRYIVARFFEADRGVGMLGNSAEFQHARTVMPISRGDTIFAFLSTSFFSGLVSPRYQIELGRRLQAVTDLELVQLAQLTAAGEGASGDTIDALIAGGFLPEGFGRSVDGSGPIVEARRVIDSKRGARGAFTPIPDVALQSATAAEVAEYHERAQYYAQQWRQFDPLMVAVRRSKKPNSQVERLTIDANISPLAEEKYGWIMSLLGPPVVERVAPREGDVISMQAYLTGGQRSSAIPPHILFLGIQDMQPNIDSNPTGIWQILNILRTTPGYLGAWPKPGFLDWLPLRPGPVPDGYSRLLFDVWRWQGNGFSVLSFHRDILEATVPQLRIEDAEAPAQIRVHVGDLSQSQLRDWVTWLYYQRARQTSAANVGLLHALTQQMRVPPDKALEEAERILDTRLICPLEGKYELVKGHGRDVWRSTAWNGTSTANVPPNYRAPLLQWFRGMELELTKSGGQLVMHGEIDMHVAAKKSPSLLDLLGGKKDE